MDVNPVLSDEVIEADKSHWTEWYGTVQKVELPWSPDTTYSKLSKDEWLELFRLYSETDTKLDDLVGKKGKYRIARPTFYKMFQKYAAWLVDQERS